MTSSDENIFLDTGLLWRESTGDRWIPLAKASDAELCSAPEQMVEQTIETPVNRDAIALIMTSLQWRGALFCAWTNGWANHRDAGESRRHRAHYDVTVMESICKNSWSLFQLIILVPEPQTHTQHCCVKLPLG